MTEYTHLGDGIIISEDALEVIIFNAIYEVKKKNDEVYFELIF